MNTIIKKYEKKYPTSPYFPFIAEMSIPKTNADVHQEYKLLLYLLSLKRKYMYIFLNKDPNLKDYYYKKTITFTKQGFSNFRFFILDKSKEQKGGSDTVKLFVYISKKKLKIPKPFLETSDNNIFKTILTDTTIEWLNKSLYLKRKNKLKLYKSLKTLNTFCDFLTSKYTELELNDIELKSGSIYLLYGLRDNSDIDIFAINSKKYKKEFPKSNKKYDIKNINTINKKYYNSYINSLLEPVNFFYYRGIKMMTLKLDLTKSRSLRVGYPRAIADFLMVDYLLHDKYPLPEYPKTNKFKKDVQFFIKTRYRVYDYTLNI